MPYSLASLRTDCRHYRGDIPCRPHKQAGVHCTMPDGSACPQHDPVSSNILIIKLGAAGDVVRTTPLFRRFRSMYPHARFWWLTYTPDVVPSSVDVVLQFTPQTVAILGAMEFDLVINLDKDREACALAALTRTRDRKGYTLANGIPVPVNSDALPKYLTGVFDDISKANTKSYVEEIFEIAGLTFEGERYILDNFAADGYQWNLPRRKTIIGLNTGCGGRWVSRLWPEKNWITLARQLKKHGYAPLLLGGEAEHLRNRRIARASGALYRGHFPLRQFINLVDQCDLVVTAVTLAMHITIGLGKKIVLFNNIFNRNEFELYGQGEILEPGVPCTCYYSPVCVNNCMQHIHVGRVVEACKRLLAA